MIPIFRKGIIFYYDKIFGDLSWSNEEFFEASSFFVTALNFTQSEQESYSLSYMYIMSKKYSDMIFEKTYMDKINLILDKVNY